jgi:asparagine synthase (glutamine-hydrolysing)
MVDFCRPPEDSLLARMCRKIEHRGPNSRGAFTDGTVALGIQRLAIIDVEGGDQPIFNEDRSLAVVMNGEIYNHESLRRDLEKAGHRFRTRADTEVLVHLYEDHGDRLVDHLRGMFAFALWDTHRQRLLCARDRVGKKPLYWTRQGHRFSFASEVQSLLQDPHLQRAVEPRAIDAYLTFQYVPHPMTAFRGIHKLPPASTLVVDSDGEKIERYWSLDYTQKTDGSPAELEERLLELVREATRIRLMSEVPLGAFLSGGIDSSAVVAAMAEATSEPVQTFSIGFEDPDFDELKYARLVADRFGTDHHEFEVQPQALEIMPRLARHYGDPFGDPSAIPSFYLSELTARDVTVALNGDGGDESFAGYGRYHGSQLIGRLDWLPRPLQRAAPSLTPILGKGGHEGTFRDRGRRLAHAVAMSPWERYCRSLTAFDHHRRSALMTREFGAEVRDRPAEEFLGRLWDSSQAQDPIDRMLDVDINSYLPGDLLPKIDIATMAHSLEARSPFLDHELMEFAASLPGPAKLNGSNGKAILKGAFRGILPDEVLDRPKMGFGVPLAGWFRNELRDLPAERLLDPAASNRGYFEPQAVERLIGEHQNGQADHSLRLWTLLQLETWHTEVLEAPIDSGERVA